MEHDVIRIRIDSTAVVCGAVRVSGDEVTVDAKTADGLVERNLATVIGEQHVDELDGMTVEELKEYASEAGVCLDGISDRDEMVAAIREAM